jgi:hypothetical protein
VPQRTIQCRLDSQASIRSTLQFSNRKRDQPDLAPEVGYSSRRLRRSMCGRLRVGKENLHVAGLVGARRGPLQRCAYPRICARPRLRSRRVHFDLYSIGDRIEGNGLRVVICEDASRFARELVTQKLGIIALIRRRVRVLTASGDDLTVSSDPSRKMCDRSPARLPSTKRLALCPSFVLLVSASAPRMASVKGARARQRSIPLLCAKHADCAGAHRRDINGPCVRLLRSLRSLGLFNDHGGQFSASSIASMLQS